MSKLMEEVLKRGVYSKFDNGESGLINLINYKGKKYVLRRFKSKKESDEIYKICKKLEKFGFLPKLLYRKRNLFVFDFIPGKECKKPPQNLEVVRQVAKICSLVNKTKINLEGNPDKRFRMSLKVLLKNKKINKEQNRYLNKFYLKLKKKVRPKIVLELWDLHQGNFVFNKGKIYFVDVGGIRLDYIGVGIIKSLSWFKTNGQRKTFKEEYNKTFPISYFSEEYENFIRFYYYINSVSEKILKGYPWGEGSQKRLNWCLNYLN